MKPIMSWRKDTLGRPLGSLRVSVIDRCNLRCQYCMPEEQYIWLPSCDILSVDEIGQLVDIFTRVGVTKVRLTGGEPLLRQELVAIVKRLAQNPRIKDLALTSNGSRLVEQAEALYQAGLHRITVSLDSLRAERFKGLTRRDTLGKVLAGINAAKQVGFLGLKINTVVIRGFNEDELIDLIEFGKKVKAEVRFIEYMDVGGATHWSMDKVFSKDEMLACLEAFYGSICPLSDNGLAPADHFLLPDGTRFGIVASVTAPFCRSCNRSRVTADGLWYLCLYAQQGIDLRALLRGGAKGEEIEALIARAWQDRTDRGAEKRLNIPQRGVLYPAEELKKDPHREMHTRGG